MPVRFRRPFLSAALVFSSLVVGNAVRGMEPPALLPDALLRKDSDGPPPPAVHVPVRVRQALVQGTTYEVRIKGTMKVDAEYKKFLSIQGRHTLNYAFDALIERHIVYNDGKTIVEDRYFREVKTVLVGSQLLDQKLTAGPVGQTLIDLGSAAVVFAPGGVFVKGGVALLQAVLKNSDSFVASAREHARTKYAVHTFAALNELSDKKVRLWYVDGEGVKGLVPLKGDITEAARAFHMSSAVLSDCLLFHNDEVPVGKSHVVDAEEFADLMDPTLMVRLGGKVQISRAADKDLYAKRLSQHKIPCAVLNVEAKELVFRAATYRTGPIVGTFSSSGTLYFDLEHHLIVAAELKGSGEMETFPKHHLLRSVENFSKPELHIVYSCRILPPRGGDGR